MTKRVKVVPVFIPMMGCAHQCIFCNQHAVTGISSSQLSTDIKEQLTKEMSCFKPAEYNEIAFFGGSFTRLSKSVQNELLDMAQPYMESGEIQGIRFSARPDYIAMEHLNWLSTKGVKTIELGIQSTDEEVLKASGRGHSSEVIFSSSRMIRASGFNLGLQMMIGLPGDTARKSLHTALDIIELKPNFVRIYPALVLEGSPLAILLRDGTYSPLMLQDAVEQVANLKILFEANAIAIIRTGLQANEGLDTGQAYLAGPYHPAFGEMADSRIYLNWIDDTIQTLKVNEYKINGHKKFSFYFHPSEFSKAVGQKRSVLNTLKDCYPEFKITIKGDAELKSGQLRVDLDSDETDPLDRDKTDAMSNDESDAMNSDETDALDIDGTIHVDKDTYIQKAAGLLIQELNS